MVWIKHYASKLAQAVSVGLDRRFPVCRTGGVTAQEYSSMVQASVFYPSIQERYENFSYNNLTTLNYTDAIVNFNPTLINSKIKSDYILFEEKDSQVYNHMGIAMDYNTGTRYIETFFHQDTDMYKKGQTIVKVKSFALYSPDTNVIVTDSF